MSAIFITFIIMLYTMQSFLCKKYTDNYPGNPAFASSVFTIVSGVIVAAVSFIISGFGFTADPLTIILGIINAIVLCIYNYAIVKCSQDGPYSVLIVFSLGGAIIIPAIVAYFAFSENLSPGKIISIVVIIISMYLMSLKNDSKGQKITAGFIISCIILAVSNGMYGSLLNVQQKITGIANKEEMIATTFLCAALISLVTFIIKNPKEFSGAFRQNRLSCTYLISCSVVAALAINTLTYLLSFVNVGILYTFENSGVLLVSVLLARIFLKEELSKVNIAGCIFMSLGLIGVAVL